MNNTSSTNLPKRKNIRLPGYDYSQNGAYFVTICTKDKTALPGEIVGAAAHLCPRGYGGPHIAFSQYGQIVHRYIMNIPERYQDVSVPVYCIMPNHIL